MTEFESLLFIHIPRTGGTSVRRALSMEESHEVHVPAREWARRLGPSGWSRVHAFSVVRNPWERAVSLYAFLWRGQPEGISPDGFRWWVHSGMPHPSGGEPTLYAGTPYEILVTAPQVEFLRAPKGFVIHLIPHEHLARRFRRMCVGLSILPVPELPHLNAIPRPEIEAFYDRETFDLVTERYRSDSEELMRYSPPKGAHR